MWQWISISVYAYFKTLILNLDYREFGFLDLCMNARHLKWFCWTNRGEDEEHGEWVKQNKTTVGLSVLALIQKKEIQYSDPLSSIHLLGVMRNMSE